MSSLSLASALVLAIGAAQIENYYAKGRASVASELVCWMLIAAFRRFGLHPSVEGLRRAVTVNASSTRLLWTAATSITVAAVFSTVGDFGWLIPAVAPCLVVLRNTSFVPALPLSTPQVLRSPILQACMGVVFPLILVGTSKMEIPPLIFGAVSVVGLTILYATLIRMARPEVDEAELPMINNEKGDGWGFDLRAVAALAVPTISLLYIYPGDWQEYNAIAMRALLGACFKAVYWTFVFWLVRNRSLPWEVAPLILTYASAANGTRSTDPSDSFGTAHIAAQAAVALFALFEVFRLFQKLDSARYVLLIFAIMPLVSFLSLGYGDMTSLSSIAAPSRLRHPIENIITKAQLEFASLQQAQSTTLQEATAEYRRRYSREPPPGFDKWFEYARKQDSVLIDNFDQINHDLRPFWRIDPKRLRKNIDFMAREHSYACLLREVKNGELFAEGEGYFAHVDEWKELLQPFINDLPEMRFIISQSDEPRVIMDPELLETGGRDEPQFTNETLALRQIAVACQDKWLNPPIPPPKSPVQDQGIGFIQPGSGYSRISPCEHPALRDMHGTFVSLGAHVTHDIIPLLGQSAPVGYNDVLQPSFWYLNRADEGSYDASADTPWEEKANQLNWAGSTTGAWAKAGSWKLSHRQRFVDFIQRFNRSEHTYLKKTATGLGWEAYDSRVDPKAMNFTLHAKFSGVFMCDEEDCQAQVAHFADWGHESKNGRYKARFLFDVDGNAFSGRYYTLLRSNSLVFKQTALREWHDERLVPWVHYVPVSMEMDELPELMRYFSTEEGSKKAKEIAYAGRDWVPRALRKEDFRIYMFRLLLELARVLDPERPVEHLGVL